MFIIEKSSEMDVARRRRETAKGVWAKSNPPLQQA